MHQLHSRGDVKAWTTSLYSLTVNRYQVHTKGIVEHWTWMHLIVHYTLGKWLNQHNALSLMRKLTAIEQLVLN